MGLPLRLRSLRPGHEAATIAALPGVREALLFFSRERAWINERHLALCRVPAPTFFEEKRAQWMADQLRSLGCQTEIDRAGNVVAFPMGDSGGPLVALTAHLDTVLAPRNEDEIRVGADGRYLGPGISDNGCGLAALLAFAAAWNDHRAPLGEALAESKLRPVLVANVGEEGEGNLSGMRYLCRQSALSSRIQSFLVLDGPGVDHITAQALGSRRFEVSFTGTGGHSWSDFGTPNAVHALAAAISEFTQISQAQTRNKLKASVNFGMIDGGSSVNSIPSHARAKLDVRSESADRMEELSELLTDAVERALVNENERAAQLKKSVARMTARIREIGSRPSGKLEDSSPLLAALRSVDAHLGIRNSLDCASTDANIPLSLGMQAVSIGTGGQGGGAHTPAEWFHPEGRDNGLRRVLLTAMYLLRRACPSE